MRYQVRQCEEDNNIIKILVNKRLSNERTDHTPAEPNGLEDIFKKFAGVHKITLNKDAIYIQKGELFNWVKFNDREKENDYIFIERILLMIAEPLSLLTPNEGITEIEDEESDILHKILSPIMIDTVWPAAIKFFNRLGEEVKKEYEKEQAAQQEEKEEEEETKNASSKKSKKMSDIDPIPT